MFITGNKVQDQIISQLNTEPLTANELSKDVEVSIQSIHKALKKLLENKVILKTGVIYSLNQEWVVNLYQNLSPPTLLQIQSGESFRYSFNSYEHLERFWKHTILPLLKNTEQVFIYNPHWIWLYLPGNLNSELAFVQSFKEETRGYFLIGGETLIDKLVRKKYQHKNYRINTLVDSTLPRHKFLTIIDSLILTTQISRTAANKIDELYNSEINEEELSKKLQPILEKINHKITLKIENNSTKAERFLKKVGKDFAIKNKRLSNI